MSKLVLRSMAVAISAALAGACGDETIIYPGGPAGPASGIAASRGLVVLHAGESATIGLRAVDDSGNTVPGTAPSISSCDASIASVTGGGAVDPWTSSAEVSGVGLGQTCLLASAGSVPPETVRVNVGPRLMNIVGPDTVLSGASGSFTMAFTDATGATVAGPATGFPGARVTSGNLTRLVIVPPGDVSSFVTAGQATGTVTITANLGADHGGATARKSVVVAPGVFAGTLSQTAGLPGDLVAITRASDGHVFDADASGSLGNVALWVERRQPDTLYVAMPATGTAGAQTLSLGNLGALQVVQNTTYTSNSANNDKYAGIARSTTCQAPGTAPTLASVLSPTTNSVYVAFGGTGTGAAARSCTEGGATPGPDMYFEVTAGATDVTLDLTLSWTNGSDLDILICDGGVIDPSTLANCDDAGFSSSTTQEVLNDVVIAAGTTRYVIIATWTAGTALTNARLAVTGL